MDGWILERKRESETDAGREKACEAEREEWREQTAGLRRDEKRNGMDEEGGPSSSRGEVDSEDTNVVGVPVTVESRLSATALLISAEEQKKKDGLLLPNAQSQPPRHRFPLFALFSAHRLSLGFSSKKRLVRDGLGRRRVGSSLGRLGKRKGDLDVLRLARRKWNNEPRAVGPLRCE